MLSPVLISLLDNRLPKLLNSRLSVGEVIYYLSMRVFSSWCKYFTVVGVIGNPPPTGGPVMTKLCQSCFARPPLARTKKNPKYRIILNHDLCKECERRVWDQIRVIENLSENKIIQKSK